MDDGSRGTIGWSDGASSGHVLHVGNVTCVGITHVVGDDLSATVWKVYPVLAACGVAVADLVVAEIGLAGIVSDLKENLTIDRIYSFFAIKVKLPGLPAHHIRNRTLVAHQDRPVRIHHKVVGVHRLVDGRREARELVEVQVPKVQGVARGELHEQGVWQQQEQLSGGGGDDRRVHQLKQQRRSKRLPRNSWNKPKQYFKPQNIT